MPAATVAKRRPTRLTSRQREIRSAARAQRSIYAARAQREQQLIEARARARAQTQQQSVAARTAYSQAVTGEQIARARAKANQAAQRSAPNAIQAAAVRSGTHAVGGAIGPSSGIGSTLTLILFTMAGLIVVYLLVTKAQQFQGFTQSLGVALGKLTSTQPLFQKVSTQ